MEAVNCHHRLVSVQEVCNGVESLRETGREQVYRMTGCRSMHTVLSSREWRLVEVRMTTIDNVRTCFSLVPPMASRCGDVILTSCVVIETGVG